MDRMTRTPDSVDSITAKVFEFLAHRSTANKPIVLANSCIFLARAIDDAIAKSKVPRRASELPSLLKQVCQFDNPMIQAGTMVLLYSMKYACKKQWFSDVDAHEIIMLANKLEKIFLAARRSPYPDMSARKWLANIRMIYSSFCPNMKMGRILSCIMAKPGYNAYVMDFIIKKEEHPSRENKIYLFAAKVGELITFNSFIPPPNINFLLNGKEVMGRNMVSNDIGPQIPTEVTHMLSFGPNILQIVGPFSGNYVIGIAYIADVASTSTPVLRITAESLAHHTPAQTTANPARPPPHRMENLDVARPPPHRMTNADVARPSARDPRISRHIGESSRAFSGPGGAGTSQNSWRPSGQMRGSLTGAAYEQALARLLNPGGLPQQPPPRPLPRLFHTTPIFPPKR